MTAERLSVDVNRDAGVTTVKLDGELDIVTAGDLQQRLEQVVDETDGTVRLDLSGLTFVDSTGLSTFVAAHRRSSDRGVRLEFAGVAAQTRRLMDVTKLSDLFHFADD